MWPSEYMLHEHRKDMLRIAAEAHLVREFEGERLPLTQSLLRLFKQIRLRRPQPIELTPVIQPQCTALRRVS